ncbi:MAG: universal stress protein [Candidatus Dormibacteraeota bacterium]|nr:universal stress protein [Candidatus Dormibacteraeota bacterium]
MRPGSRAPQTSGGHAGGSRNAWNLLAEPDPSERPRAGGDVENGSPGHEIVAAARDLGADLIVIGSRPQSSLHNWVAGSTTGHGVAHVDRKVLVARG